MAKESFNLLFSVNNFVILKSIHILYLVELRVVSAEKPNTLYRPLPTFTSQSALNTTMGLTFWHLLHTLYIKCKNTGPKKGKIMK
jgi:hypothetical protein